MSKIKEFPNKIKEFTQYSKIKEFPNKIKEFSNKNKIKIKIKEFPPSRKKDVPKASRVDFTR